MDAKEKLEDAGFTVEMFTQYGDEVKSQGITQVTVIYATKDEDFLHAYFFASEEDTEAFYKNRTVSLEKDVEVIKKNKYSIYRGTKNAVDAFLK